MAWDKDYRPQKFEDVQGQPNAVRLLQELVRRKTLGRHLLLHGHPGSGKTTLIRIVAMALNCTTHSSTGSPCLECSSCQNPSAYLFEYDTPGKSGDLDKVSAWVNFLSGSAGGSRVRVIFFDEAHALTSGAQDCLLKSVVEAPPNVIFCFATTDRAKLKPALRSRLMDIRLQALSSDDAVIYLQTIAQKTNLTYDREALYLLVAVHPPYMRDLANALERLSVISTRIDVDLVRSIYDVSAAQHVSDYCLALASGDQATQTEVLSSWSEEIADKISLTQKFLLSVYYNDILGQHLVVDPLVFSLSEARREFVSKLYSRLQVNSPRDLGSYFQAILSFWTPTQVGDRTTLHLQLARFESFMNDELASIKTFALPAAKGSSQRTIETDGGAVELPLWMSDRAAARPDFIDPFDIENIVNRASFFAQQHGHFLNVSFKIEFTPSPTDPEASAVQILLSFLDALSEACLRAGGLYASISLIEREGRTIFARTLSYIDLTCLEREALGTLFRSWTQQSGHTVGFTLSEVKDARAFHWDRVRELCGGFQKDDKERDLRKLLRVPKEYHRAPGPISHNRLFFSPLLSEPALKSACENGMTPLSAMDDEAWDWISSGWELKEYPDRLREVAQRDQVVTALHAHWQHNRDALQNKLDQLYDEWRRRGAELRPREWDAWW